MFQMKKQDPSRRLSAVEIGNLPKKESRIMIVKMTQDLRKRMKAQMGKIQKWQTKS